MDWESGERRDRLVVALVDPTSYAAVGYLGEVVGGSVVENYESDTRIAGTVSTLAPDTHVDLSMMRLIHEARLGSETYRETLGTFFALRSSGSTRNGHRRASYDLKSVLYGMEEDHAPQDLTMASGTLASAAFDTICKRCQRRRQWQGNDTRWTKAWTLEAGDAHLSWLHQLASRSSNRLDVTTSGLVSMGRYVAPRDREPLMRLAWNSPLVTSAEITDTTNEMEVPSRAIVTWEHEVTAKVRVGTYTSGSRKGQARYEERTDMVTVTGWADAPAGSRSSIGRRGYRVSTWHREDDLGAGRAAAEERAKRYLAQEGDVVRRWDATTFWFPLHAGDVLLWRPRELDSHVKVMVTDVTKDLTSWTMRVSMKEV